MYQKLCELKSLLRAVGELEESIRSSYGVTLTEALCLCSAAESSGGALSAGTSSTVELGSEFALSPSRLSRILGSLERKGFIVRHRRQDDRRSWDLRVTAAGVNLLQRMKTAEIELPAALSRS
jgi:DNA-binding MarR family transcriptional regulator